MSVVTPPLEFSAARVAGDFAGSAIAVSTAGQLTTAFSTAGDGQRVEIALGSVLVGQWTMRNRGTAGWVEIRAAISTATLDAACPEGTRMTPTIAAALNLPIIKANQTNFGIGSAFGAAGYRFTAIQLTHNGNDVNRLLSIGDLTMTMVSQIGERIGADRCVFTGNTGSQTFNCRRGAQLCGRYSFLKDCYLRGFGDVNSDAQPWAIYGAEGPYLVQNCHSEGWSESFLCGGNESALPTTEIRSVPCDIVIRGNYFTRDITKKGTGAPWAMQKNGGELKSGLRILIENNVSEYSWQEAQVGYGFNFKSDNGGPSQNRPLVGTQDVEVRWNKVRNTGGGLQITSNPNGNASGTIRLLNRLYAHDNLFEQINIAPFTGAGTALFIGGGLAEITLEHNTFVKLSGGIYGIYVETPVAVGAIVLRSNIFQQGTFGVKAGGVTPGQASLTAAFGGLLTWANNALVGGGAQSGPNNIASTQYIANDGAVGYTNLASGGTGYALAAGSPLHNAGHDGLDIGVTNISALETVTAAAIAGTTGGIPTPPPPPGTPTPVVTSMVVLVQPSGHTPGAPLAVQPQIGFLDQFDAPIVHTVVITATPVSPAVSASANTKSVAAASSGTFAALQLSTMSASVSTAILFSAPGLPSVSSNPLTVTAANQRPTARFTWAKDNVHAFFNASTSTDDVGVVSYAWDFGDSTVGSGVSPSHIYASAGTYNVTLVVTDAGGLQSTVTQAVTVTAPTPPLPPPTGVAVTFVQTRKASGIVSGRPFRVEPRFEWRDINNQLVTTETAPVVVTITGNASLIGTATKAAVGGVVDFAGTGLGLIGPKDTKVVLHYTGTPT